MHVTLAITLAVLLAVATVGCGRQEAAPSSSAPVRAEAEAPAAPRVPDPEPIVVTAGLAPIRKGPVVIDPGGFRLGAIAPESAYETRATLSNTGSAPITILSAKSSCLCTVPEGLKGAVISPGGSHPFSMTFKARNAPGAKDAKVWVRLSTVAGETP